MALTREVVGALSHAELVALVLQLDARLEQALALIGQQQALIAQLEARVRDLEQQVAQRDRDDPTKRLPGLKPRDLPRQRKEEPRKPRSHGFSRRRQATPTEVVEHGEAACPGCQTPLSGGRERWRKEVVDLPPVVPARVIHHVDLERTCPSCGRHVAPPRVAAAELGVLSGRQRLGTELLAQLAVWRTEFRLPVAVIAWGLPALHGLELSEGAIVAALQRVAAAGQATVDGVLGARRASPHVHADETGLREDGRNGYLWSFSTPTERYSVHGSRKKEMVDTVLGPDFSGVLSSDFYAAYDHYLGPHQRCWRHLLADVHQLVERHPTHAELRPWAEQVQGVYSRAQRFVATAESDPAAREREQRACEAALLAICQPFLPSPPPPGRPRPRRRRDPTAPLQRTLCERIQKYLPEMFTFVAEPAVGSTHNAAERCVRPAVVQRKISGGTRSPTGTSTFTTLQTLFGTWRARHLDPLVACRTMLLAHAAASV